MVSIGDNQMKRLVLTFLSMAAVCAVVSATPADAEDTVTGAPRGTTPVTLKGTGTLWRHGPVRFNRRPGLGNRGTRAMPRYS